MSESCRGNGKCLIWVCTICSNPSVPKLRTLTVFYCPLTIVKGDFLSHFPHEFYHFFGCLYYKNVKRMGSIGAAAWQNQQIDLCAQRRFRSAWASAWVDQSSLSAWRKPGSLATHWVHSEDSDQTGRMPKLIWVFTGRTSFCWFCCATAHWVPCLCNTSNSFIRIFLKLCRCLFHGMRMCMWFAYSPEIKFCHFFHIVKISAEQLSRVAECLICTKQPS